MPGESSQVVSALDLSALTYADYLIAAAEEFGYGQTDSSGLPVPPTDTAELARCRKAVLRGLRRFALSNPSGWFFMRRAYSLLLDPDGTGPLNVDSDPAIYNMPWWFNGASIGDWNSTGSTNQGYRVRCVDPVTLASQKAASFGTTTGMPVLCCFRKAEQTVPTREMVARYTVEFWPSPSNAETLTIDCEAWLDGMANTTDRFVAGQPYDRAAERCVICEAAHDSRKGRDRIEETEKAFDRALMEAIAHQNRRPALIGKLDPVGCSGMIHAGVRTASPYSPEITFGAYTIA